MVDYLSKNDLIKINRKTIKLHGGNFLPPGNFHNEIAADSLLESVPSEMFGEPLYPTIAEKASLYFFNIISYHVFSDGNKRTGLQAARTFVRLNDWTFKEPLSRVVINDQEGTRTIPSKGDKSADILFQITIETASSHYSLDEIKAWFTENILPPPQGK